MIYLISPDMKNLKEMNLKEMNLKMNLRRSNMNLFLWIDPNPNQILKLNEMKFQHFVIFDP